LSSYPLPHLLSSICLNPTWISPLLRYGRTPTSDQTAKKPPARMYDRYDSKTIDLRVPTYLELNMFIWLYHFGQHIRHLSLQSPSRYKYLVSAVFPNLSWLYVGSLQSFSLFHSRASRIRILPLLLNCHLETSPTPLGVLIQGILYGRGLAQLRLDDKGVWDGRVELDDGSRRAKRCKADGNFPIGLPPVGRFDHTRQSPMQRT